MFRESVAVAVDAQVVRLLETARDHLAEQQWEEAIPILQELIETKPGALVAVETGRYWNTADYCHLLLSQMSDDGLAFWRARTDPQARLLFEAGQRNLDAAPLEQLLHEAFCSSYGDDALWLLGELAFEQGRYAAARHHWSLLVAPVQRDSPQATDDATADIAARYLVFPDCSFPAPEVYGRLILCSIFEGKPDRASAELTVFREIHPRAEGTLNGKRGDLVVMLQKLIDDSRSWPSGRTSFTSHPTFAGSSARSGWLSTEHEIGQEQWHVELQPNRFAIPNLRPVIARRDPLSYFPVVDGETVYYCDADRIRAISLRTGKAVAGAEADGTIFTNVAISPRTPSMNLAGVPRYTMTISDGRLYARMGPPVSRRSLHEGNTFSEIVGLDIASGEGASVFHVTSDALDHEATSPEATGWSFEGTPVVSEGRVFVSARRGSPEDETLVACFDSVTGRLLWKQRICASLRNTPDHFNLIDHRLLTLGDGRLFIATGNGAIAALAAESGRVLWIVTYESRLEPTPEELSDETSHTLAPCVYDRGVVYAAPGDSDRVFALDATTGHLVWDVPARERVRHLLGVVENRLVVTGAGLHALDTRNGSALWTHRSRDAALQTYGRGVLTGKHVYWPLQDSIWKVQLESGELAARYQLRAASGDTGGNLLIAGGLLLIAGPNRIVALAENVGPVQSRAGSFVPRQPRNGLLRPVDRTRRKLRQALSIEHRNPRASLKLLQSVLSDLSATENDLPLDDRLELQKLAARGLVRLSVQQSPVENLPTASHFHQAVQLTQQFPHWFSDSEKYSIIDRLSRTAADTRTTIACIERLQSLLASLDDSGSVFVDPASPTSIPSVTAAGLIRSRIRELNKGDASSAERIEHQDNESVDLGTDDRTVPWPVRPAWSVDVSSRRRAFIPDGEASVALLMTNDGTMQCLDTTSGTVCWEGHSTSNWTRGISTRTVLALINDQSIEVRKTRDGGLLWRRQFEDAHQSGVALSPNRRQLLRMTGRRLVALDLRSGSTVWQFPPRGQQLTTSNSEAKGPSPILSVLTRHARVQFRAWRETALLRLDDGLPVLRWNPGSSLPARRILLKNRDDDRWRVAGITEHNQLLLSYLDGPGFGDPEFRSLALGQHPPVLHRVSDDRFILIEDAQFAEGLNARGDRLWRVLLGSTPMASPSDNTLVTDGGLLVFSSGKLRRYSVDSGLLAWETRPGDGNWLIHQASGKAVCLTAEQRDNEADSGTVELAVFHSQSGHAIQRMTFEDVPSRSAISIARTGCLVRTRERLVGLVPWGAAQSATANSPEPRSPQPPQ